MESKEFKEAISSEKKHVDSQLKLWEEALEEATKKVEYWKCQSEAMSTVHCRVNMAGDTFLTPVK